MRFIIISASLLVALLCGCSTGKVCDARGDVDICEIHHRGMHPEVYSNPHLTVPPTTDYLQARFKYFRHSKPTLYLLPDECKKCKVNICEECVAEETKWKATH
jgi:hypothetical protein